MQSPYQKINLFPFYLQFILITFLYACYQRQQLYNKYTPGATLQNCKNWQYAVLSISYVGQIPDIRGIKIAYYNEQDKQRRGASSDTILNFPDKN